MSMPTFKSEAAKVTLRQIEEFIKANDRATCKQLAERFGICFEMMRKYLRELNETGRIKANGKIGTSVAWSIGSDPAALTRDDSRLAFNHKVAKTYPANHARSAFDCLLFGVPEAMREAV